MNPDTAKYYPLSSQQKEIWVNQMLHPGVALFNVGGYACIKGTVNSGVFGQALNHVVQMHEALRIRLHESDGLAMQSVAERPEVSLDVRDFSGQEQAAQEWMQHEHAQAFPLYDSFLFQFALCKVSGDHYYWFTKYHYLIADGKTLSLIVRHVAETYSALMCGRPLPAAPLGYRHYVAADQAYLTSAQYAEDRRYWRRKYQELPAPLLHPQHAGDFEEGETVPSERTTLPLSRDVFERLEVLATAQGLSVGNLVLGILYTYFARIKQQDDFVVGVTHLLHRDTGKNSQSFAQTAGYFMNVTPVRCAFGTQTRFSDLLQTLAEQAENDARHGLLPIGEINRQAKVSRENRKRFQLFELELAYIDFDCDVDFAGVPVRFSLLSHGFEQYALTVYVARFHATDEVPIHFDYNQAFFNQAEIKLLTGRFEHLLQQVLERPDTRLRELELMPKVERDGVLRLFNDTNRPYSAGRCIHQLFEAQVGRTPDATAVMFAGESLSYTELNQRANQLAHYLQSQGVEPETRVGLCVERSLEMIVGLLGIIKAGGAYVPLDPNYPQSRLAFMLQDAQVPVLLTQAKWVAGLASHQAQVLCLDRDWGLVSGHSREDPCSGVGTNNLAYVIYTSGSTGKPKGVMLVHAGLCNLVEDHIRCYGIQPHSRILQFVSLSFDVATADIFMSLCAGARLCLPPPATQVLDRGLLQVLQVLQELAITHVQLPAPVLAALPADAPLPALQVVATGAEAPAASMVRQWSAGRRYFNVYGPTEATVCVTMAECRGDRPKLPIGAPIANTQIYILDEDRQPVPIGVAGELYIGGVGLARGYLNRPDLTAEKFVANPFTTDPSTRLYKTGDLACYLPDGNLEFLGRIDQQIKIRGFRIELGEIGLAIGQYPSVRDNAVVLHESATQGKRLVAYLLLHPDAAFDHGALRDFLKAKLPEYMLPAVFVVLEALPFTPNGKVDRQALAQREVDLQPVTDFIAPRTPEERQLAACWAEILGLERIGVHDNFFELGGDSLKGMQLVTQLQKQFNRPFQLASVFRHPTVAEFAAQREELTRGSATQLIQPVTGQTEMPLSFSQEEVWRHNRQLPGDTSYNICNAFRLSGHLQLEVLRRSFGEIMQRHSILRTGFHEQAGEPVQVAVDNIPIALSVVDISALQGQPQAKEVDCLLAAEENNPFDLEIAPLWRVTLLRLGETSHVLIVCFHHIIEDAWSVQILLQELTALYTAFAAGEASPLEPLAIQYADFAHWQRRFFTPEVLQSRYRYWQDLLANRPEPLRLPIDKPCTLVQTRQTYRGGMETYELSPALTQQLRALGQRQGSTLSVVLLATYVSLLYHYSGQRDMVIGMPMSKRNHHQVEPLMGYFSGMSVLRVRLPRRLVFLQVLEQVQIALQQTMENQDLTLKQVWNSLQLPWSGEQQLLFRPVFNFIPVPREAVHLPDLTLEPMGLKREQMVRDLVIGLWDKDGSGTALQGFLRYRQDLFEAATIRRMVQQFQTLLAAVAERPGQAIDELLVAPDASQKGRGVTQ